MGGPEILLKGAATHVAKVSNSALGTIRSVEYTIQNLDSVVASSEQAVTDTRRRITDLTAQIGQPFEYRERLTFLTRRQQEIADALDLTKNQAACQLDATSTNETTESVRDNGAEPD